MSDWTIESLQLARNMLIETMRAIEAACVDIQDETDALELSTTLDCILTDARAALKYTATPLVGTATT